MRHTGIDIIGDVPWGTHFCQFYQDKQDLIDILVPYFKEGLANNEYCMWVTSEPLRVEEAQCALAKEVQDLEGYLCKGQLRILDYSQWYTAGGTFDSGRVLQGWVDELEGAQRRGFDGLRLTGNTFWLEKSDWQDFTEYEAVVDGVIGRYAMLAICTYSLVKCGAPEIMDVVSNHAFALIKRAGKWQTIESAERKRMEASLRESERRYSLLFDQMTEGFALNEIICDETGRPSDYRFLEINPAFERMTGLRRDAVAGKTMRAVLPDPDAATVQRYGEVALTGQPVRFGQYSAEQKRQYEVLAYRPAAGQFAALFTDITERRRAEEAINNLNAELARSNQELEQFAYVASHDLQEPLRAVTGYLSLLEDQLRDTLDENGRRRMNGAVQGAARMHTLISDLLALSRIGSAKRTFEATDLEPVLDQALDSLRAGIQETGAKITRDPLPTLAVNAGQMTQLFQNLLGNSLKFRGERVPEIHVSAQAQAGQWIFAVRDNGIGIEPQYSERVFLVFQRLHSRSEYPGTGIGLAICKKIVERHGGKIWVESQPGEGSKFCFTIPSRELS